MHGTMDVMDRTGHTTARWDRNVPAEVAAARATFDQLTGAGYQAFKIGQGQERGERLRTFDPTVERMILIPQLQGG